MSIYERILKGEKVRVQFKDQEAEYNHKGPFTVQRLLLMGPNHYVTESSEWARFAHVGGVIINNRRRERMDQEEVQSWCAELEEVSL